MGNLNIDILKVTQNIENEVENIKGDVHKDDTRTAELFQTAGFSHVPEKDAEGILLYVGSGKSYSVFISPKIRNSDVLKKPGETFIYNLKNGVVKSTIFIDENNKITITADNADVEIDGNNVKINGTQIQLNGTSKSLVTHAELNTALQTMIGLINGNFTAIATAITGLGGSYIPAAVTLNISAAEAASLKTDG